jgi:predicted RNA-binding Zn-ribbon protein involved in translation (DUF1610 family)
MIEELEFDGAHRDIVAKKAFAYRSPRIEFPTMPRGKINLQKILASLNWTCPKCGRVIEPKDIKRVSWDEIECPECGNRFEPKREK